MLKENKKVIIITSVLILLPIIAGVLLWPQLPDTIVTHFGTNNEPDGWSSKGFAVFAIPALLLALHLLCIFVTAADPKRGNISGRAFALVFWICPAISIIMSAITYITALGMELNVGFIVLLFLGLLFIALGNYLPKCRQNYTLGIKLPWTLSDAENWSHTHRVAGWSMTLGGAVILLTAYLRSPWIFGAALALSIGVPAVYSYVYYQKHARKE